MHFQGNSFSSNKFASIRHWLRFAVMAAFAGLVFTGCAAPRSAGIQMPRAGQVYCIRGLMDVFSLGMNTLADELREQGVDAYAISGPAWPGLAQELGDEYENRNDVPPLVFIGHSYGADDAVRMARYLDERQVRVSLLVLLDATIPPKIPRNVDRCVHLYRATVAGDVLPFVFAGNPVIKENDNNRTHLYNCDLNEVEEKEGFSSVGHMNIDKSDSIHARVIKEVLGVCQPKEAVVRHASGIQCEVSRGVQ